MKTWPELLAERNALVDCANSVPGDDRAHDAEVERLCDRAVAIERQIMAADPSEPFVQGVQLQLAAEFWAEEYPLEAHVRAFLHGLAVALILTPVPIHQTNGPRRGGTTESRGLSREALPCA